MKSFIQGRVVDSLGQPVAGASVYFVRVPGSQPDIAMLSGDNGDFALPAVTMAGAYRVGASAPGMTGEAEVFVTAEDRLVRIEIRMGKVDSRQSSE